jgi:hypothetical protein
VGGNTQDHEDYVDAAASVSRSEISRHNSEPPDGPRLPLSDMSQPTPYDDLDAVLRLLVDGVRLRLGHAFIGADMGVRLAGPARNDRFATVAKQGYDAYRSLGGGELNRRP